MKIEEFKMVWMQLVVYFSLPFCRMSLQTIHPPI